MDFVAAVRITVRVLRALLRMGKLVSLEVFILSYLLLAVPTPLIPIVVMLAR